MARLRIDVGAFGYHLAIDNGRFGQLTAMLFSVITFCHFVRSSARNLPSSSGVLCEGSRPMSAKVASNFGSFSACLSAALSLATTSGGVFAGANTPHHEVDSKSGKPDSAMVGISGAS